MKKNILICMAFFACFGLVLATSAMAGPHHWWGRGSGYCKNGYGPNCGYRHGGNYSCWNGYREGYAPGPAAQYNANGYTAYDMTAGYFADACVGKGKGQRVSFEMPDGSKVDITCGGPPETTK